MITALYWWELENDTRHGSALVAAATEERAVELLMEYLHDPVDADNPIKQGWHGPTDCVPGPMGAPGPPTAEGVYQVHAWL